MPTEDFLLHKYRSIKQKKLEKKPFMMYSKKIILVGRFFQNFDLSTFGGFYA